MFEANASVPVLAALGFTLGMAFWGSRRAEQVGSSSPLQSGGLEPDVKITGAEFFQAARAGLSGIFYEPTMDFRLSLENRGTGRALDLRARVSQDSKYYWMTGEGLELDGRGGSTEVIMHCQVVPPLEPGPVTWVEMPLRLEYRSEAGGEWYTEAPVRLKLQRHNADLGASCWWVDVLEPQTHGRAAGA